MTRKQAIAIIEKIQPMSKGYYKTTRTDCMVEVAKWLLKHGPVNQNN